MMMSMMNNDNNKSNNKNKKQQRTLQPQYADYYNGLQQYYDPMMNGYYNQSYPQQMNTMYPNYNMYNTNGYGVGW